MEKNKAEAPTLLRIRYVCFDLTHAPKYVHVFDSLRFLDTHGTGTNTANENVLPRRGLYAGDDACPEGSLCANIPSPILSERVSLLT